MFAVAAPAIGVTLISWSHRNYASILYIFTAGAMLSVVYAVAVCLCVSVCLSHSSIVAKRLKIGLRK